MHESTEVRDDLDLKYRIRARAGATAPLAYFLHGRAGNYDAMWIFARALSSNWNIIAPQAVIVDPVLPHSPNGLSWWLADGAEDTAKKAASAAGRFYDFYPLAEAAYRLKPVYRIAFGFSQGAALLSYIIQDRPLLFSAAALLSGFVVESDKFNDLVMPRVFISHGTKDDIIDITHSRKGRDYLTAKGYEVSYHEEENLGHKVGSAAFRDLKDWVGNIPLSA